MFESNGSEFLTSKVSVIVGQCSLVERSLTPCSKPHARWARQRRWKRVVLVVYDNNRRKTWGRNLCDSGIELLRVIKWELILESPAQFQKSAVHTVEMLLIVGDLHYSHHIMIDSSAVAVIWRRENDKFLGKFEGALEFCWRNEVTNPWTRLLRFSAVSYNCITAVLSQWVGFLPWEIWLPSPGKASCNRVLLPNLWCMLGVLMFP